MDSEIKRNRCPVFKRYWNNLLRPSIVKKILFGYVALSLLIIIISIYTLSSLEKLNRINDRIIKVDVQVIDITNRMFDNLFSQERYARRYFVLKSPEMLALFRERSREFDGMVEEIYGMSDEYAELAGDLASLYAEYRIFILKNHSSLNETDFDAYIKQGQDRLVLEIQNISSRAKTFQHTRMLMSEQIGSRAFRVAGILCGFGIFFSVVTALMITRNISRSINQLKQAAKKISKGMFEDIPDVKNRDELGELSLALTEMAGRLKLLDTMRLDASPLTHLPGGVALENEIASRINSGLPMVYCFADLDNFKAYNDRYSYAKGNEVIKATARIMEGVVLEIGMQDDFIGHIGGDDFVLITSSDRYDEICDGIINRFKKTITAFYEPEDIKRGFIIGKNRRDMDMKFPLMTISIAVITNRYIELRDPIQVGEIAAELKQYAKSIPGNVWISERRRGDGESTNVSNVLKN